MLLIITSFFGRKHIIFPLMGTLLGLGFINNSFAWNKENDKPKSDISVLSYNVKLFREYNTYDKFSEELISWVVNDTSDIKCIQEFCTNANWPELNTSANIKKQGYNSYEYEADVVAPEHSPGMAIFSKLPIINKGMLWSEKNTINGGMFIDVMKGNKTIRVYNIHLASMYLDLGHFKEKNSFIKKTKYLLKQLKAGAIKRSEQIEILIEHTTSCKHPYIVVGDFNETPYNFNYKRLARRYKSSFNDAGNGFGFSFHGFLFFLRIDHQFYSSEIGIDRYEVNRKIKVSDHFPTKAWYTLPQ